MVTTIQLRENTKEWLDSLKESERQTYEDVIINLMKLAEISTRKNREILAEGYKEMAKETAETNSEWQAADAGWD
ncbi:MAG: hypothetical protein V1659_04075 [Candidatus Woesearchaeota archaeon]